jgi:acyl carrier protein
MLSREVVQARISEIFMKKLGLVKEPALNAHLVNDLGADSLDNVEIIMAVEDLFDINVSDSETGSLQTFGDVVECTLNLLKAKE